MEKRNAKRGLATLCIGGGMGCAAIVERQLQYNRGFGGCPACLWTRAGWPLPYPAGINKTDTECESWISIFSAGRYNLRAVFLS